MKMNSRLWMGILCHVPVVLMVVCMASIAPVFAEDAEAGNAVAKALEQRIEAGDLQYRDPSTGQVVLATEERIAALRFDLERHFGQPAVFNRSVAADGTVSSVIGDAIRDVYLVRTNLDGTRTTACLRDLDGAVAFVVGLDTVETGADPRPVVSR